MLKQTLLLQSPSKSKLIEGITSEESSVNDSELLGSASVLQEVTMATVEENEFSTELEEKVS